MVMMMILIVTQMFYFGCCYGIYYAGSRAMPNRVSTLSLFEFDMTRPRSKRFSPS